MKVAIIGAGGFVGARLIESFHLADGPTIVAVARHPARLALAHRFCIDLRAGDPLEVKSLAGALSGCGAAVHVAEGDATQRKRMPVVLCRAAAEAGVRRLVFLSSAAVHGPTPPPGTDEKSPLHLRHPFEENNATVTAERHFFAECRRHGLTGFALRPGLLYGPRAPLIASLATELQQRRAWILQKGEGITNCLYIDNLVGAIRLCLKAKSGAGSAYLLTDAETVTWREFHHAMAHQLELPAKRIPHVDTPAPAASGPGDRRPHNLPDPAALREWLPPRTSEPRLSAERIALQQCAWQLPSSRAMKDLGYRPTVSFHEGIRRSCAWWRFACGDFRAAA
jgi:2-alkyl-3-oxoalkanoate reductase